MLSLRERLAGLAAARAPQAIAPRARSPVLAGPGYSVREELVPLTARPGLPDLPALDPQTASLLLADRESFLPPLTDWLFLDLETTGLAGGTGTYAFLVGLAQLAAGGLRLRQFFLRDLAAESALLAALEPFLAAAKVLVTYNGKQFDAPLLETRFRLARRPVHDEPAALEPALHLDFLYPARRLWKGRLSSLRLLDLEQGLLGYRRPDDVPGERIPGLYFDFLRGGREQPLEIVFRHNAHDIVTLAAVTARVLSLLAAPETARDPEEIFALGRFFERAGQRKRACALYESALSGGLPAGSEPAARFRLALLYKRARDYERALVLWRQLLNAEPGEKGRRALEVYEELAICYEHRLDDPEAAAEITRRALAELGKLVALDFQQRSAYEHTRARFARRLRRLTRHSEPPALLAHCTSLRE